MVVKAGDPESQATFAAPGVAENQIEGDTDEEKMDGVEAVVGLAIRATLHGQLKLGERAGFLIGELTGTADVGSVAISNSRISHL